MANLMTHEKIIDDIGEVLPDGQCQNTGLNIELSSFTLLMFYDQILGGQETCKSTFDVLDCHWMSLCMHIV